MVFKEKRNSQIYGAHSCPFGYFGTCGCQYLVCSDSGDSFMKEKTDTHLVEYAVLLSLAAIISLLFYYFRYDHRVLIFLSGVASFGYVLWGIIHHAVEGRLTKFIAAEYAVFGVLIFFLLYTVLSF